MVDPTFVGQFSAFSVKMYIPFLNNVCVFVLPVRSGGVLALSHSEEKCACNQMPDGCVQVRVRPLVNVQD